MVDECRYSEEYPPDFWCQRGLEILSRSTRGSRKTQDRRFRNAYGVSWFVCSVVWKQLSSFTQEDPDCPVKKMKPDHLLMGLHLLRSYKTETENSSTFTCDEKTFRKWSWGVVEAIASLHIEVVRSA